MQLRTAAAGRGPAWLTEGFGYLKNVPGLGSGRVRFCTFYQWRW